MKKCIYVTTFLLLSIQSYSQSRVNIVSSPSSQAKFAIAKIYKSLIQKGHKVTVDNEEKISNKTDFITIILTTSDQEKWIKLLGDPGTTATLKPEGFSIRRKENKGKTNVFVIGKDLAGLMYGGLELAEIIKTSGLNSLTNISQNPYMLRRGVKMNIPLDVRTPSYTDASDAAQHNIPEMWSMDFWTEYIDSLASYRYNFISLWSLHPFPSMVQVPEYPDVALQDVHRSTVKWNENYSTRGTGIDGPDITGKYEVVKKISIEEKMKFWQDVMRYGKERNIDFYIVTWNIFTNSTKGNYGITDDINNAITKDYFRKSIKQLFITYPDLAGIGLTTGENMPGADFEAKENWSFETYAQGVLDVAKLQPNRKITFIHRQHETGALDIVKKFETLIENKNINFIFSFKYAQAHVYSSTTQIHHPEFVKEIQSKGNLKTHWTLRNDDVYYFRWGSPEFVREFIKNIPMDVTEGYYYGSDQYVWGREFLDKYPDGNRSIEIAKHWYQWMLWGRLGYNPAMENNRFIDLLQARFPGTNNKTLFDAWQSASMIYPLTTGFHWGALDFQWYIEGSKSRPEPAQTPSGYHDINRFITLPPYKGTDFISIADYVKIKTSNAQINGTTPFEVAGKINQHADNALALIQIIPVHNNPELYKTREDIKAMSYLGKYYAHKINAATNLALFRSNSDQRFHDSTIQELNLSALYWRYFASTALTQYKNPLWTNRVGYVDWKKLYQYVIKDITDNGGKVNLPDMITTSGGTLLEAETAEMLKAKTSTIQPGYTGTGYISATDIVNEIKWAYMAQQQGTYVLEFKYISKGGDSMEDGIYPNVTVNINSKPSGQIIFWKSGSEKNWVWDRVQVQLPKGKHVLSIILPENILLDHVNVLSY